MVQSKGSRVRVMADTETVFGSTPGTPNGRIIYAVTSGVTDKRSQIESPVLRSTRQPSAPILGNLDVSGPLNVLVDAEGFGFLLKHLLGEPAVTGAGPYVHTFKAGNTAPAGMVLEHDHTDQSSGNFKRLFNGCKINNLAITVPQEGHSTAVFDILGKTLTADAASFDATPTDLGHSPFSGFDAAIEEGGASLATATDVTLNVTNNMDGGNYTIDGSGGLRTDIPEGMIGVSGNFNALFDSTTLLDKAVAGTTSSLKLTFSRGDGLGSAGNESVEFLIPELKYAVAGPEVSGPQGLLVPMSFMGFFGSSSEATAFQAIVKNSIATY